MKSVYFERAIFLSWYCSIGSCKFCFMMTLKGKAKNTAIRSKESILAETILAKKCNWKIEFLSAGWQSRNPENLVLLLRQIKKIIQKKLVLNIGPINEKQLIPLLPFVDGICAAIETVNPNLHRKLCPDKPIESYLHMFRLADKYRLKKSITIILGIGETEKDIQLLVDFIRKYQISRITLYALNPIKGTIFEKKKSPTKEYMVEWISMLKRNFPGLDIVAGVWSDKISYIPALLNAGANSITKFPVFRLFGTRKAIAFGSMVEKAGYIFESNFTKIPKIGNAYIDNLHLDKETSHALKIELGKYLVLMKKRRK